MTEKRITLTARSEFELARAAGFDTYDDFVRWKEEKPDEYEQWYRDLIAKAAAE
jgi:hypothetical protein